MIFTLQEGYNGITMKSSASEATHFESLYPASARHEEISRILGYIKKGNSAQVVGLPGVGRSNTLRLLAYNNALRVEHLGDNYKWYHFVYMDLSEIKGRSFYELVKFILISLSYSLSERKMEKDQKVVNDILKEAVSFQDELILFQALKRAIDYLSLEKELTVVLLFDRFDTYFPNLTPNFFTDIRVLRNRAKYRFSCVFSLERPLEELLESAVYSEFAEFVVGNNVYLTLSDPETNNFRFSYLEKTSGRTMDKKMQDEVLRLTAGHGKLSRIALEGVLAEDTPPKDLENFLLSKSALKGALLEIWNALTPAEQKQLLKDPKDTVEDSYLALSHLVTDGKIQIPLFEKSLEIFPHPASEKLTIDEGTQEIKLGDTSLTDTLSPSEFKLLRFLLQNRDRVCEKEEIINAVWTDAKTREGVTDQALDQIVYRVRKKIEEDPNSPTHLTTVKGRGYKFSE